MKKKYYLKNKKRLKRSLREIKKRIRNCTNIVCMNFEKFGYGCIEISLNKLNKMFRNTKLSHKNSRF